MFSINIPSTITHSGTHVLGSAFRNTGGDASLYHAFKAFVVFFLSFNWHAITLSKSQWKGNILLVYLTNGSASLFGPF